MESYPEPRHPDERNFFNQQKPGERSFYFFHSFERNILKTQT
jgi:hypothetical protein